MKFAGTAGWRWESAVVLPRKPVLVVYLFCLFRYRRGQVDFDDVTLRTLTPSEVGPKPNPYPNPNPDPYL